MRNPRRLTPTQIHALRTGSANSHNTPNVVIDIIESWTSINGEQFFPINPELEEMIALCRIGFLKEYGRMPAMTPIQIPIPITRDWPQDYPKSLLNIRSAKYVTCIWFVTQLGLDYHRENLRLS